MSYSFKIWNQSNDDRTMAIRAKDNHEVRKIARNCSSPSSDGVYQSMQQYITALATATTPLSPFRRDVDVFWNTNLGYGSLRYFDNRILEITYSGNQRQSGGYSAQCYMMIDPNGYGILGNFHLVPIRVDFVFGNSRDLVIVSV